MSQLTDALPRILHAKQLVHEAWLASTHERVFTRHTCGIGFKAEIGRSYHSIAFLREECSQELATSC